MSGIARPKESRINGRLKSSSTGRTTALRIPSSSPAKISASGFSAEIPGTRAVAINTAKVVEAHRTKNALRSSRSCSAWGG